MPDVSPTTKGQRDVVLWCSNDYLGMGQHPKVVDAMVETATRVGTGAGGTSHLASTQPPMAPLSPATDDLPGQSASMLCMTPSRSAMPPPRGPYMPTA